MGCALGRGIGGVASKSTIVDQHKGGQVRKELARPEPSDSMQATGQKELEFNT